MKSKVRSGIPALGSSEAIFAADRALVPSAAVVRSLTDVIVDGLVDLVKDGIQVSDRVLALGLTSAIDEGDHAAEDGRGSRGTRELIPLSTNINVVRVTLYI
jgi:hypothetical protein